MDVNRPLFREGVSSGEDWYGRRTKRSPQHGAILHWHAANPWVLAVAYEVMALISPSVVPRCGCDLVTNTNIIGFSRFRGALHSRPQD
jgi:predicted metal-dependent hydrolase